MNAKVRIVYVMFDHTKEDCAVCLMDQLQIKGDIVLTKAQIGVLFKMIVNGMSKDEIDQLVERSNRAERAKIDMADVVLIIEPDDGITEGMATMANYAFSQGKECHYFNKFHTENFEDLCGETNED